MLMIRLKRTGRRNHAEFRVVVTEHARGPKSNDFVEILGVYNPHTNAVTLKKERVRYWLSVGAQASDTVHNLLIAQSVIEGKKRNVLPKKTPPKKDEPKTEATSATPVKTEQAEEEGAAAEVTPTEEVAAPSANTEKEAAAV